MRPSLIRPSAAPSYAQSLAYATNLLRKSDYDAFLPSYFFPAASRPAYLAIRALNVELAQIDDQVSNAAVARIRYQWWRDAVKGALNGSPPPHPIPRLLAALPQSSRLSSYHFSRLINTRERHYLDPRFTTLQDLAEYSAGTQGSLMYLALQACGDKSSIDNSALPHSIPFEHTGNEHSGDVESQGSVSAPSDLVLDHAASHLAVTLTLAILLRSIPHHASKRINVIPVEIASRHGLSEEALFRQGPNAEGLRESVATMVGIAQAELRTSRECFDGTTGVPASKMGVFLGSTPATALFDTMSSPKVEFDVFRPEVRKLQWSMLLRLWMNAKRNKF